MTTILLFGWLGCDGSKLSQDERPTEAPVRVLFGREANPNAPNVREQRVLGHTFRLYTGEEILVLEVLDAWGPIAPTGDARVLIRGIGEEPQRLLLKPNDGVWSGPASTDRAPGYDVVVDVELNGAKKYAGFTWGNAPSRSAVEHGEPLDATGEGDRGD